jgi:hypothetical protein
MDPTLTAELGSPGRAILPPARLDFPTPASLTAGMQGIINEDTPWTAEFS